MSNAFALAGKKILVTGASSGIGRQIAIEISNAGATAIITGRNNDRLHETIKSLSPGDHKMFAADLNREEELNALVAGTEKIDGLVLSAGIMKTIPFRLLNRQVLQEVMETNFIGQVLLVNKLIQKKLIANEASIVFISSIGGNVVGTVGNAAYSASKGAIEGIQKVMALELAPKKIRVNSILPGMVRTEMWSNGSVSEEQLAEDEKKYPLGYGEPSDVAHGCIYLLSHASRWVTGSSLVMDGGFSIQ